MTEISSHIDGLDRIDKVELGSDRSFGFVFTAVFVIIALWPLLGGMTVYWWALAISAVFLLASIIRPSVLRPLNGIWFRFGQLLHKIVSPLIMGLLFYLTITPMALIMRMLGKTPLPKTFDPTADSYWIIRQPPGPAPETIKNQF